ncbi:MAG: HEAT repeat domain-containing protein, partial [Planctomycetes bacterium]|nr:HEAT repeat domain-containing protein [Planctomycetota bacterium]
MAHTRTGRTARGAWARLLAGVAFTSLGLCGCSDFWETITSHDFEFKALYEKPNPLVVLRDSTDGDKRARALRALKEPLRNGGTEQDQQAVLDILTAAATKEPQPLCRLAAIEALGHFQDPRAVEALKSAFFNAGTF